MNCAACVHPHFDEHAGPGAQLEALHPGNCRLLFFFLFPGNNLLLIWSPVTPATDLALILVLVRVTFRTSRPLRGLSILLSAGACVLMADGPAGIIHACGRHASSSPHPLRIPRLRFVVSRVIVLLLFRVETWKMFVSAQIHSPFRSGAQLADSCSFGPLN